MSGECVILEDVEKETLVYFHDVNLSLFAL